MIRENALRWFMIVLVNGIALGSVIWTGMAGTMSSDGPDEAREAFVEAFNAGDLDALRQGVAPTADLILPDGSIFRGQREIVEVFESLMEGGTQITMEPDSQRYITSDVVIEDGVFSLSPAPAGMVATARYTVVLVKDNGRWVVVSIRDSVPVSQAEEVSEE